MDFSGGNYCVQTVFMQPNAVLAVMAEIILTIKPQVASPTALR
jgi:hypothetical protein